MVMKMMGQTNTITASPYSLFEIVVNTGSNIGKNSDLGGWGYDLQSDYLINTQSLATFVGIPENIFFVRLMVVPLWRESGYHCPDHEYQPLICPISEINTGHPKESWLKRLSIHLI